MRNITTLLITLLTITSTSAGNTLLVPSEYPTIQSAIDATIDGDEVVIAPGRYTGDGNRDIDFKGKAITVRSIDPNDPNIVANTVIDCNGTRQKPHGGFVFRTYEDYGGGDASIEGLTIINGSAQAGGAIWSGMYKAANLNITNCVLRGNFANYGGAICCLSATAGSVVTINGCDISDNAALTGAGIYCGRLVSFVESETGTVLISKSAITENVATDFGGGIACSNIAAISISDCIISNNSAGSRFGGNPKGDGGGICLFSSSPTIVNCTISGNFADRNGAAIFSVSSNPKFINCAITDNSQSWATAPICSDGSRIALANCTIAGNTGSQSGAILCGNYFMDSQASSIWVTNCILFNEGDEISITYGSTIAVTHSCIEGGWAGEGNINDDPCFAFQGDWHLMSDSPCIDAGTNDPCGGLAQTDFDGNPRIIDGDGDGVVLADIGAYEYNRQSPSIAVSQSQFTFACALGGREPQPQVLSIRNCGGKSLNWQIAEDCPWLEVQPTAGTSTGQIDFVTINIDANAVGTGVHQTNLKVFDINAVNNPRTIEVIFRVGRLLRVPRDFNTIQSAIDEANNLDWVVVADGRYTGMGNRDIDFKGKAITVRSENGPEDCIIDCNGDVNNPHRGFCLHSGEDSNSVIDGFTITNGYAPTEPRGYRSGGAIYCYNASPTVSNCSITRNYAISGGGINLEYSKAVISNCQISNNRAGMGMGGGVQGLNTSANIIESTISDNYSDKSGGGIDAFSSFMTIRYCTIRDNDTRVLGGGISCRSGNLTISYCKITGNSAYEGSGIFTGMNSGTRLTHCQLIGNIASKKGGAIATRDATLILDNCLIVGNKAVDYGGGIDAGGKRVNLANCTFAGNHSANGNALAVEPYPVGNINLANCILWDDGNEIWKDNQSAININYSNIRGGWPGEGNIDADPFFVAPDTNDYRLRGDSPCIDTGDANYVAEANETDLDGNPRVIDGNRDGEAIVDMGAYEYVPPIEAQVRIMPKVLNLKSRGNWLLCSIRLPNDYSVADIDTKSVILQGQIKARWVWSCRRQKTALAVFDRNQVQAIVTIGENELTVTGQLKNGDAFEGSDVIRVIEPGRKK